MDEKAIIQSVSDGYLNCDLNARFIKHKAATYLPLAPNGGVEGVMVGDVLIVDRSLKPLAGRVIFTEVEGEYCVRRLIQDGPKLFLVDDTGIIRPKLVTSLDYYHGTVTHCIHSLL